MPTRIYNRGAVADPAAISSGCNVNRFGASPANRPSDSRLIAHNYRLLPHLLSHILLPDNDPTPLPGSNIIWRLTHRLLMQFLVAKILHHHCFFIPLTRKVARKSVIIHQKVARKSVTNHQKVARKSVKHLIFNNINQAYHSFISDIAHWRVDKS